MSSVRKHTAKKPLIAACCISVLAACDVLMGFGYLSTNPGPEVIVPEMTPQRLEVETGRAIHAGKYEIRYSEWRNCFADGGCSHLPKRRAYSREGDYPAVGLSWIDVNEYISWLNLKTQRNYRLPTGREWAAIAAGARPKKQSKLFSDPRLEWAADYGRYERLPKKLKPSGAFGTSAAGVFDLNGNVWEWTSDCWNDRPDEEKTAGNPSCAAYKVAGEHETYMPVFVRDPANGGCSVGAPPSNLGFRLVLDEMS